ncbi:carboxypeptidase regulatory-like domain-containing protein [Flavobacterium sp. LPB0248]|uniref:carboxypeptidase regulatory-like domain-containing protein n=1 Tax=Flavobacterium sp. LPB0248 TaxID=2614441 RepID=UPI0015A6F191|nr:carboxypeptidase regulatory-like domain-containing protein [Flavobacterium sp. LPB0248]QLC65575.1 carboxypeptidase regulatory-like domain-containing protein [Flavobacterium sp. LPB0248]
MKTYFIIEFLELKKAKKILFLFFALTFLFSSCSKDDDTSTAPTLPDKAVGKVTGTVKDENAILAGATIILKQTGKEDINTVVGTDGTFVFENIPAGNVVLVASFPLYASKTTQIVVEAGKTIDIPIILTGDDTTLTLIPDAKFEEILIKLGYDVGPVNGSVPTYKIVSVKNLNLNDSGVADLTGLQDFKALERFSCSNIYGTSVIKLTSIDVSKNTALKFLDVSFNKIAALDISKNTALESCEFSSNLITNIDVSNNKALKVLYCDRNPLSTLDVTKNIALTQLSFGVTLTSVDLSKNTALTNLYANDGKLTSLDVSKNTALEVLWVNNNQLTTLDLTKNTALKDLMCHENALTSLDLTTNTALTGISCSDNKLTSINISKCSELVRITCGNNMLTSLDVSKNSKLIGLSISYNKIATLDLSNNPLIATKGSDYLFCDNNLLSTLNLKNGSNLKFTYGTFKSNSPTLQIAVDDVDYANTNWKNFKDQSAVYVSSFQ